LTAAHDEHGGERPELSVVLACDGAIGRLQESVDAIERACNGIRAEILIVHPVETPVAMSASASIGIRQIEVPSRLVPVLWGRGLAVANGKVVALTTTQFRVESGWARALLAGLSNDEFAGVGGRMVVSAHAPRLTRAAFLIRYSEHMGTDAADQPRDIAGDNAAYVLERVLRDYPEIASGFWEVDVHRLMRSAGERFGRAPEAVAEFEPAFTLREMIANRFVHGGHFGSYRVRALGWPRWRAVAVTPLVPIVLLARILGRVRRSGQSFSTTAGAMPYMILLLIAWAAGEACGAVSATSKVSKV